MGGLTIPPPIGPRLLYKSGVPTGIACSGTVAANGALTLGTALAKIYTSGLWLYFPAGAVYAGSVAGLYWVVMSSTTLGTIYNNIYTTPGALTPPVTPTPIVAAGPGIYAGALTIINLFGIVIPGGLLGSNGSFSCRLITRMNNTAGAKLIYGDYAGTRLIYAGTGSSFGVNYDVGFANANNENQQVATAQSFGYPALVSANLYGAVDSTVDQSFIMKGSISAATDWHIIEYSEYTVMTDGT